jgi:hypothetical protein
MVLLLLFPRQSCKGELYQVSLLPDPELSLILSSLYVKNEDDPFVVVGGSKRGRGQRVNVQPSWAVLIVKFDK